ncbi:MAG: teichoic acid transport system permease protein [Frankiaceae bacterium]|nr:teichoic acid transport system permease protein [Frankiaceae bacterium]
MTTTPGQAVAITEAPADDEYFGEHHVYQPHRAGIPDLHVYFRQLWARRHFAAELSRSNMRAAHTNTFFGQMWLVINPVLLAGVYYVMVNVLSPGTKAVAGKAATHGQSWGYFAHLCAGLFAFYFISGCMTTGGQSVIGGGKLIMNTAFPRMLLPLSAVRTGFFRFLPTMIVYAALHIAAGLPINAKLLLAFPIVGLMTLFAAGLACLFGTLYVYFRDVSSFIPYFNRIWLYLSPVIIPFATLRDHLHGLGFINPLYSLIGLWSELLTANTVLGLKYWLAGTAWAVGTFLLGSLLFMSREREFAVRI